MLNICFKKIKKPQLITFGANAVIEYIYNSVGQKIKKSVINYAATSVATEYLSGFQYKDGLIQFFPTSEGYVNIIFGKSGAVKANYVFNFTDHLGNVRLSYAADEVESDVLIILEENNYYAFGLKHTNYNSDQFVFVEDDFENVVLTPVSELTGSSYKYKYNGKELQEELGLNMTAMDFRQYDSAIGRFNSPDLLSALTPDWTPYRFGLNNPVFWSDPSGLTEQGGENLSDYYRIDNIIYYDPNVGPNNLPKGATYEGTTYYDEDNNVFWDENGKSSAGGTVIEEVVVERKLPSFSSFVGFSSGLGGLYMDARWSNLINIAKENKFIHSNGKVYSQNYVGGRWHNALDIKASKAKFNSNVKFLGRLSTGLTFVSAGATIYDGATNGWENHHTADLALTGTFYYIAAACGPFGWVAGATYFVGDMAWQAYSGESITESLFDEKK